MHAYFTHSKSASASGKSGECTAFSMGGSAFSPIYSRCPESRHCTPFWARGEPTTGPVVLHGPAGQVKVSSAIDLKFSISISLSASMWFPGPYPAFPFSVVTDNLLMVSNAFIHAGFNVIKALRRSTPNG
jgi:hypothetical protein